MYVIATERGYFGGRIIEPDEGFHCPDELWAEELLRPFWAYDPSKQQPAATNDDPAFVSNAASDVAVIAEKQAKGKGSGLTEALGGPPPDWLPKAVTE